MGRIIDSLQQSWGLSETDVWAVLVGALLILFAGSGAALASDRSGWVTETQTKAGFFMAAVLLWWLGVLFVAVRFVKWVWNLW